MRWVCPIPRFLMSDIPKIRPLVLKRRAQCFDDHAWIFELKYDGFRALLEIDSAAARLMW